MSNMPSSTDERAQIVALTDQLNALENESRRILRALTWASQVRTMLLCALLLFIAITAFLFYQLYTKIKNERIAEVQRIVTEQPEEFTGPLTKQLTALVESEGPYLADVFRKQVEEDSDIYIEAIDTQRNEMVASLQTTMSDKLKLTYATLLDEQEAALKEQFPVLQDPDKLANFRNNMEKVYKKIGQRYYVDFLKDELEEMTDKLDKFPESEPRDVNIPVNEQIATEFIELVRMMLVHSDRYVIPEEEAALMRKRTDRRVSQANANDAEANKVKADDTEDETKVEAEDEGLDKDDGAKESEGDDT